MDEHADDAGTQQRKLQHISPWLHDGSSLRAEPIITSEADSARDSFTTEGTGLHLQHRGSVSFASTEHHARSFNSNSSSAEAQMYGFSCLVRKLKPARLGCAIIELNSSLLREQIMIRAQQFTIMNGVPRIEIRGVSVSLRRHVDNYRTTQRHDVLTSIFISWSHWVEKHAPLPLRAIVDAFDALVAHIEAPQPDAIPSTNLPNCSC
eukprot:TRINITY_DN18168_c0_g1_i2.p1 TRINITY_DN18168_c0_g1~~TRINITY_DN18168_c0_g1_i2.p1  ORF type:complete len:207 (+),score=29.59 TRINITY_DN18168_c0_g1_i2:42-662(+)